MRSNIDLQQIWRSVNVDDRARQNFITISRAPISPSISNWKYIILVGKNGENIDSIYSKEGTRFTCGYNTNNMFGLRSYPYALAYAFNAVARRIETYYGPTVRKPGFFMQFFDTSSGAHWETLFIRFGTRPKLW